MTAEVSRAEDGSLTFSRGVDTFAASTALSLSVTAIPSNAER